MKYGGIGDLSTPVESTSLGCLRTTCSKVVASTAGRIM